ncbi:MAG TPA: hypothetical protein VNA20_10315 [Frankiaceae bacterium]|nr:hypothetical protein [Frankiaceae bacterium]
MRKTLRLRRETLTELSTGDLTGVRGGELTGPGSCICPTWPGRLSCVDTCVVVPVATITCAESICRCTTG